MTLCDSCQKADFENTGLRLSLNRKARPRDLKIEWSALVRNKSSCVFCLHNHGIALRRLASKAAEVRRGSVIISHHRQTLTGKHETAHHIDHCCIKSSFTLLCTSDESPKDYEIEFSAYYQRCDLQVKEIGRRLDRSASEQDSRAIKQAIRQYANNGKALEWYSGPRRKYKDLLSNFKSSLGRSTSSEKDHLIPLGRTRPLAVDCRILKIWKETCLREHTHDRASHVKPTTSTLKTLRLIDVHKKCLVEHSIDTAWVALSYVWGVDATLTLSKENFERLTVAGSLDSHTVPKTIHDAMIVTRESGEAHLWVDALCIIQDNELDKQKWIPCMDDIYARSVFTIIAASGTNADSGLPGMRPDSRSETQCVFQVDNVKMITSLRQGPSQSKDRESGSSWDERGWTLQEDVLSTRKLIFINEKVLWQCQQATFCEETQRDLLKDWALREPDDGEWHGLWRLTTQAGIMEAYQTLVDIYSTRELKFESDRMSAFRGITQAFKKTYGLNTLWALPTAYFDFSLTWTTTSGSSSASRTDICPYISADGTIVECPFPSWSWLGWRNPVNNPATDWRVSFQPLRLLFHTIDRTGETRIVEDQFDIGITRNDKRAWEASLPWFDKSRTKLVAADFPASINDHNLWAIVLGFWTSIVVLNLEINYHEVSPIEDSSNYHRLLQPDNFTEVNVRALQLQYKGFKQGITELVSLVLVRYTVDPSGHEIAWAIITDVTTETGLCKRRGLVEIAGPTWRGLEQEWKKTFLV